MIRHGIFYIILLCGFIETSQNYVQRHILSVPKHFEVQSVIFEPLTVPCSTPMCTGPLAPIYCAGPILTAAWQFGLQSTCPGEKLKFPAKEVLDNFGKLQYPLNKSEFAKFCQKNFENTTYLQPVSLPDWRHDPSFLNGISNPDYKKLASAIHEKWSYLARRIDPEVYKNRDLYPIWPVQNAFIVPGGRFDIYFYWDTYWIIRGLIISDMPDTVKGIINNFADLLKEHGYIPNSGNIQLSRRTQPPLFSHMVWEYTKYKSEHVREWIEPMRAELEFWERNRSILHDGHTLFVYKPETDCPRPENFMGDYYLGLNRSDPTTMWRSIASACESGWDFSSRWMESAGQNAYNLVSLHTDKIIPVDLNVFMARNYMILSRYYDHFGNVEKANKLMQKFELLRDAIHKVFWHEPLGAWFDFDMSTNKKNLNFHPSNVYPLLVNGLEAYAGQVAKYVNNTGALNFAGGVPTTLPVPSSQQWDFPNVWAPNQHILIQSFLASENHFLIEAAQQQSAKFVQAVYNGLFKPPVGKVGAIWEKYDARTTTGTPGSGGEYSVQEGFGWTNGAALDMIHQLSVMDPNRTTTVAPAKNEGIFGTPLQATLLIVSWGILALILIGFVARICYQKARTTTRTDEENQSLLEVATDSE